MKTLKATMTLVSLSVLVGQALPALAAPSRHCARVTVLGIGNACRRADGTLEVRSRSGHLLGLTHGPDMSTADGANAGSATPPPAPQRKPVCVSASENHVELIYARANDDTDRYSSQAPLFLAAFEQANGVLNAASLETGPDGADYKVLCSGGAPTIAKAVLPTSKSNDSFGSIVADLRRLGYTSTRAKYLVLYDEVVTSGVAGTAQIYADDRLAADNKSLRGGMFAVSYTLNWKTVMHELSHTMGAVQHTAPHSTKGYHCYDGLDVMCYRDSGSNGSKYASTYCPNALAFDCNKDDYFHSKPAAGSYLASHWNLGSRLNTFVRFAPPEDRTAPTITASEPAAGYRYRNGCADKSSTSNTRPVFRGTKGCVKASVTDDRSGVDRLEIFFDGRLITTVRQFPMAALTFDLGRGPGTSIPLRLVAYDRAPTPNVSTLTILVDVTSS